MGQTPSGPRLEEGATSPDGTRGQGLPPAPRPQGPGALAPTALVPYPSAARLPQRRGLGRFAPPSEPAAAAPARVRAPCVPLLLRSAPHPLGPWSARGAPTAAGFPRGPSHPHPVTEKVRRHSNVSDSKACFQSTLILKELQEEKLQPSPFGAQWRMTSASGGPERSQRHDGPQPLKPGVRG